MENGIAVEHWVSMVCFLRVLAVKMLEVTDLSRVVPEFLGWEESGMILVEDFLQELSVMSCFSVLPFLRSFLFMLSSLFIPCSGLNGKVKSSLLKSSGTQFLFFFHSSECC